MRFSEPVEDLLRALDVGGLAAFAIELRSHLDAGTSDAQRPSLEAILRDVAPEPEMRRFTPREEVIEACRFVHDHLVRPYDDIMEAQQLAVELRAAVGAPSRQRTIMLVDQRFEDAPPTPAMSEAEWKASSKVAETLAGARDRMLARLPSDGKPSGALPVASPARVSDDDPAAARRDDGDSWAGHDFPTGRRLEQLRRELGYQEAEDGGD